MPMKSLFSKNKDKTPAKLLLSSLNDINLNANNTIVVDSDKKSNSSSILGDDITTNSSSKYSSFF